MDCGHVHDPDKHGSKDLGVLDLSDHEIVGYQITCRNCRATGPHRNGARTWLARELWNRRVEPPKKAARR
jgi:hypothetical protein